MEVESSDAFRVGEVVLLGEQEAKMVVDKGSLIFRFPHRKGLPGRDCVTTIVIELVHPVRRGSPVCLSTRPRGRHPLRMPR